VVRTHPDGELTVPRNAPTTFNLALWENGLFWDSRVQSLDDGGIQTPDSEHGTADPAAGDTLSAAQARFPVTSPDEMRGFEFVIDGTNDEVRDALGQRLTEDGRWGPEFEAAFGSGEIGRGKGDGLKGDGFKGTNDFGRSRETADRNDRFSFRTPTLINVSVTGPYLHSGAYDNLLDVVRHHLDPLAAIERFDPSSVPLAASDDFARNTQDMIDFLEVSGRAIESFDVPLSYTDAQVDDLVAFLETLTDPCVCDRACLAPWVADPATDDVDGHLLIAVDQEGSPL
jgi:cytochrome c peroxidase